MLNLLSDEVLRDPFPVYARLRAERPVCQLEPGGPWFLFDHASVRRALSEPALFSSSVAEGGVPASWLIFSDPPRHARLRALVVRAFTPRAVEALEPAIRAQARELVAGLRGNEPVDIVDGLAVPLPMRVIARMLGVDAGDWRRLKRWSDVVLGLAGTLFGPGTAAQAGADYRAVSAEMEAWLGALTAERRAAPRDDLLTRLVLAEVEGSRLDAQELLGFVQLLLLAGHETTTNLIGNALLCLLEHPEALRAVRREPSLLPRALEEVLRHRAPVQMVFRKTTRDVELAGQHIPGGALVLPVIGSANRDPAQAADAERFDITRPPAPHLAFGLGSHFCIGAALARLEARLALEELFTAAGDLSLAAPWTPRRVLHVHGPERLSLRLGANA